MEEICTVEFLAVSLVHGDDALIAIEYLNLYIFLSFTHLSVHHCVDLCKKSHNHTYFLRTIKAKTKVSFVIVLTFA